MVVKLGVKTREIVFIAQHKKEPKSLPPDTFSVLKMYPKCFCGQGSATNPAVGAHSAPPYPLTGFGGRDGNRKGREVREKRAGERKVEGRREGEGAGGRG